MERILSGQSQSKQSKATLTGEGWRVPEIGHEAGEESNRVTLCLSNSPLKCKYHSGHAALENLIRGEQLAHQWTQFYQVIERSKDEKSLGENYKLLFKFSIALGVQMVFGYMDEFYSGSV